MRVAAGLLPVLVLTGCGGGDDADTPATTPTRAAPTVAQPGPFFGECGNVTDEEVRAAFAMPALPVVTRNSVGCVWEVGDPFGPSVSFSWYRGSPIGREAAGSGLIGRPPETIQIGGQPGFRGALGNQLCEIGVQYDDNFFHWSVTYADVPPTANACDVAKQLAELTAERAQ